VRRGPRLPLEQLTPWLVAAPYGRQDGPEPAAPATPAELAWGTAFGNDRPVEIEVGFGKGLFLLSAAAACPGVNFLGVEIVRKYQLFTATRLALRNVTNVRVMCADAKRVLTSHVRPGSVQAVHVYFPDPWWKTRHHKRRLFTPEFAASCARVLKPLGRLILVTDVEDYFHMASAILDAMPELRPVPAPPPTEPSHDLDYLTNFERKFRKQGKPIYRTARERVESPATVSEQPTGR
jgi:tRNA (guanine-N7-)-methyltransferase